MAAWKLRFVSASPAATSSAGSSPTTNVFRAGAPSPWNPACAPTSTSTTHSDPTPANAWAASSTAARN